MKIKPVIKVNTPKYPDKYEIDLNSSLLYYRPKRWYSKPFVGMTLSAILAINSSFSFVSARRSYELESAGLLVETTGFSYFDHGEILPGWHGGLIGSGANFIDKKDAYEVVFAELKKAEVAFDIDKEKELYKDAAALCDPLDDTENLRLQAQDFIEWLNAIAAAQYA